MKKKGDASNLEQRFQEHPDLHQAFSEFMQKYEYLCHTNQNNEDANIREERYYLQRHAVCKSSNSITHTRVVLVSSCPSTNGLCLNDLLLVGPTIQQNFYSIVLRIRR